MLNAALLRCTADHSNYLSLCSRLQAVQNTVAALAERAGRLSAGKTVLY